MLREQSRDDACRSRPSQLLIQPLEFVGQLVVVDSEAMQDRCVEVADRDRILDHVVAVFIGLAVGDPVRTPPPVIQVVKQRG